jgi:ABC-type transport system involved in cytochrome c biogenesis permease subunit
MNLQASTQGWLIYLGMAFYLLAFALYQARRPRGGTGAYAAGFVAALAAVGFRGWHTGHAPLQNMFEVFLILGALFFPLSLFCRRVLKIGGETVDPLLGFVVLWPAGFIFDPHISPLPPALQSSLFIPHVMAYMISYIFMAKAAVLAGVQMRQSSPEQDENIYRLIRIGFPFMTLGLLLGAWWGKLAWGDYWNWDPKELWSLATWLVYLGYFHVRVLPGQKPNSRTGAVLALVGFLCVVLTLLWVNLATRFAGLHSYAMP